VNLVEVRIDEGKAFCDREGLELSRLRQTRLVVPSDGPPPIVHSLPVAHWGLVKGESEGKVEGKLGLKLVAEERGRCIGQEGEREQEAEGH
jgi:hypothetical protein